MAMAGWYITPAVAFLLGLLIRPLFSDVWQAWKSQARRLRVILPSVASERDEAALMDSGTGLVLTSAWRYGKADLNGTLHFKAYSETLGGNLLPAFLFLQGESDGLEQSFNLNIGGGRGKTVPFVPDDSCDDAVFDGASTDLRSPQLPYLKLDSWTCERKEATVPAIILESSSLKATITPQYGGKIWGMFDKVNNREVFYKNEAHQPANIGARAAWTAGGLEFNWSPGYLGHSAFTEDKVWAAKLATEKGDVIRVYEFDRYNGTVWQVDMLLDDDELWTHARVTNPNSNDIPGYWWTCAAHKATPQTRVLSPADLVTVETFVGSSLRNAPWPDFNNGMLNSSFGGLDNQRLVDSSYLGNIAYTGDYFLRIPADERKWIAHQDHDGYAVVHGHPMNGTKFFTWGQSGPGRFMQDFLAGGRVGEGYYTELQAGVKPTQQQVFTLQKNSTLTFTEYYKPTTAAGKMQKYTDAVHSLGRWWESRDGIPESKAAEMDKFFEGLQTRMVKESEIVSYGSNWGALQEKLCNCTLAAGAAFFLSSNAETALWQELATTGRFSESTLAIRTPLSYAVSPSWVSALEESAARNSTWLHDLLLAIAYAESGEIDRPRRLLQRSFIAHESPISARCLAVLTDNSEDAWHHLWKAWTLAQLPGPSNEPEEVTHRLRKNVLDDLVLFLLGKLGPAAFSGSIDPTSMWLQRLREIIQSASTVSVGSGTPDLVFVSQTMLYIVDGSFDAALAILRSECFPTLGRARDALANLWNAAVEGKAALRSGHKLSPVQARDARKKSPIPQNIGCPYATLYCENYW